MAVEPVIAVNVDFSIAPPPHPGVDAAVRIAIPPIRTPVPLVIDYTILIIAPPSTLLVVNDLYRLATSLCHHVCTVR